jgi:hypothetical protein
VSDVFVIPAEQAPWTDDPERWVAAGQQRWPDATVQIGGYPGEPTAAVATIRGDGARSLEVVLSDDRQTLGFEPREPEAIGDVVAWWVDRVPAGDPELRLYDEGSLDDYLVVGPDTTPADVVAYLRSSDAS